MRHCKNVKCNVPLCREKECCYEVETVETVQMAFWSIPFST